MKNYGITEKQLTRLNDLIASGKADLFYSWHAWRDHVRPSVLRYDHFECVECAARGKYKKAEIVHHVQHLTEAPDLALSLYDPRTGKRQLVSLCKECHEKQHENEIAFKPGIIRDPPLTVERWD